MLLDLALLPEIFENAAYSADTVCGHCLNVLKPVLINEAVVRDLRGGGWRKFLLGRTDLCHPATKEIVESLRLSGRLCLFPKAEELRVEPVESSEWCYEALATHETSKLDAILCGNNTINEFGDEPLVQPLEKIHESAWYLGRTCSARLRRQSEDYLENLRVTLKWCNSAMFIDPHLDPSRPGYAEFYQLIEVARTREVAPIIELHRCSYDGTGPNRRMLSYGDVESMFKNLSTSLKHAGLKATVFVWDTMHDRYLITNLIGILLPNGFDISSDASELTTWTRLSTKDREDVQREFDQASNRHHLRYHFDIGAEP